MQSDMFKNQIDVEPSKLKMWKTKILKMFHRSLNPVLLVWDQTTVRNWAKNVFIIKWIVSVGIDNHLIMYQIMMMSHFKSEESREPIVLLFPRLAVFASFMDYNQVKMCQLFIVFFLDFCWGKIDCDNYGFISQLCFTFPASRLRPFPPPLLARVDVTDLRSVWGWKPEGRREQNLIPVYPDFSLT